MLNFYVLMKARKPKVASPFSILLVNQFMLQLITKKNNFTSQLSRFLIH